MVEIKKWNQIAGFFEKEEVEKIQELARGKVCLEIGAFYGRSTLALAEVAKEVYTIDTFKVSGDGTTQLEDFTILKDFQSNTEGWNNIKVLIGRSYDIVPGLGEIFDLIFIDGSHFYEDVRRDIEICWFKLKQGGVMVFHDYNGWLDVNKAVDERFEKVNGPVGSLVWVIK